MVQELLNKYIWLVNQFVKAGDAGLSLPDVIRLWEDRWSTPYSRRSFCNHREAVAEVFGVEIECDRSSNRYFIRNSAEVTDSGSNAAWLINTFTVNNLLSMSKERLKGRISVESVPSGRKWLTPIMEAMEEGRQLRISYRKYADSAAAPLTVHPYGLKEHERRWYLVAFCTERNAVRVYSLDRIITLDTLEESFRVPRCFSLDDLFAGSFGIYLPQGRKSRRVVFRAVEKEAKYLRDLPVHCSQKEIRDCVFEIRVVPDDNLTIELCRRGARIEVLEPEEVRAAVARELRSASAIYEDDKQ